MAGLALETDFWDSEGRTPQDCVPQSRIAFPRCQSSTCDPRVAPARHQNFPPRSPGPGACPRVHGVEGLFWQVPGLLPNDKRWCDSRLGSCFPHDDGVERNDEP